VTWWPCTGCRGPACRDRGPASSRIRDLRALASAFLAGTVMCPTPIPPPRRRAGPSGGHTGEPGAAVRPSATLEWRLESLNTLVGRDLVMPGLWCTPDGPAGGHTRPIRALARSRPGHSVAPARPAAGRAPVLGRQRAHHPSSTCPDLDPGPSPVRSWPHAAHVEA
jgi:hypothetical protein